MKSKTSDISYKSSEGWKSSCLNDGGMEMKGGGQRGGWQIDKPSDND